MKRYSSVLRPGRVAEVLRELVRIPSVNPGFAGGTGEREAAAYVQAFLAARGLESRLQQVEPGRDNALGLLPGADPHTRLLLEAHMDTVQVQGMTIPPFEGNIRDGRLYGRGACDTKASLAAMLVAVETIREQGWTPPLTVVLAAVVDEEIGYRGVSALASLASSEPVRYAGAIVGEPTELNVLAAHKGCVRFHIDVYGRAGHSSAPDAADNAVERACRVVEALGRIAREDYPGRSHPLAGPPTHCVTMIQGGAAPNTIPDVCRLTVDRRTAPGEQPLEAYAALKARLLALAAREPGLRLDVREPFLLDYALDTPVESPLVRSLLEQAAYCSPGASVLGAPYGSDASKLALAGIPSVVFGPGDLAQAHTADEWVELEQVERATRILIDWIMQYRG